MPIIHNQTITTLIFIFFTFLILLTSSVSTSPQLTPSQYLNISTQYQHKFTIDIPQTFSQNSDITVIITSCNRFNLLKIVLNSFFHYNTYPIKQMIIIQDCQGIQDDIWSILPNKAKLYQDKYFRIIINKQRLGQFGSIDKVYSYVRTKYIYHMQDDWVLLGTYGFLQKLKDALQHAQKNQKNISQVVQTFLEWDWSHMPSIQYKTQHHTKYYILTSYGKDYLYRFSLNPHLLNYQKIYKGLLNGSYIQTIARKYHCIKDGDGVFLDDGACVENYAGKYLYDQGYKQIYVQLRKNSIYKHIGTKDFTIQSYNLQQNYEEQRSYADVKTSKGKQITNIEEKIHKSQKQLNDQISLEQQFQNEEFRLFKQLVIVGIVSIILIFGLRLLRFICQQCNDSQKNHVRLPKNKSSQSLYDTREQQSTI